MSLAQLQDQLTDAQALIAYGPKNLDHCGLQITLAADGERPYRSRPTHA
jgi:hypothetical protein